MKQIDYKNLPVLWGLLFYMLSVLFLFYPVYPAILQMDFGI